MANPRVPPLRPGSAAAEDRPARERLRFDLTRLDLLLLVEQWLAPIHSPGVAHLPPQVRRLRYENGVVAYRHRHHFLSLWAKNAQRLGW
ncbi:MAG: N-acetylmuramoyl-L-alanine amidase-like domain-containing protein [Synechococcaceae cyanobacterium]|nr:N-acetylmuramoyl-L-alanine amidase-like domain-containing protein [Synechococcaceae cyanobacterium]